MHKIIQVFVMERRRRYREVGGGGGGFSSPFSHGDFSSPFSYGAPSPYTGAPHVDYGVHMVPFQPFGPLHCGMSREVAQLVIDEPYVRMREQEAHERRDREDRERRDREDRERRDREDRERRDREDRERRDREDRERRDREHDTRTYWRESSIRIPISFPEESEYTSIEIRADQFISTDGKYQQVTISYKPRDVDKKIIFRGRSTKIEDVSVSLIISGGIQRIKIKSVTFVQFVSVATLSGHSL